MNDALCRDREREFAGEGEIDRIIIRVYKSIVQLLYSGSRTMVMTELYGLGIKSLNSP